MNRCPHCSGTHGAENHFCPSTGQPIELGPRLISQKLLERFKVATILGEGPIGIVVEVVETQTEKKYAAKLIHPQYTRNLKTADQMLADAKRIGELECPNIAQVVAIGRDTGQALTVIRELMTGECLQNRIEENGPLPVDDARRIAKEILTALQATHQAGLLNLDLSPADVFLADTPEGEIAKIVDSGEFHIKKELLTSQPDIFESQAYYAPEQLNASQSTDEKTDIYAVGAILYFMLTGQEPEGAAESIDSIQPELDAKLARTLQISLSANPANRFASAGEFIDALDGKETPALTAAEQAPEEVTEQPKTPEQEPEASGETPAETVPSVIVDMPEIKRKNPLFNQKNLPWIGGAAVLLLVLIIWAASSSEDKPAPDDNVVIAVRVEPQNAAVTVDGKRLSGSPPTIKAQRDDQLHTVQAKAAGFEPLERDIKFDESKTIELSLTEIIRPDEPEPQPAEQAAQQSADSAGTEPAKDTPAETDLGVESPPEEKAAEPPPKPEPETKVTDKSPRQKAIQEDKDEEVTTTKTKKRSSKPARKPARRKPKRPAKKTREGFRVNNPFG